MRFLCEAANCSYNLLYAPSKGDKGLSNSERSRADVSVMAWFQSLLPIIDKMPDTGWYALNAINKRTVYDWYMDDCSLFPQIFVPCQYQWFTQVWRHHYGKKIRLRKHCKFTKCSECIRLRGIKSDRTRRMVDRLAAKDELSTHYKWIKTERELALKKAYDAVREPTKFLSICQDGTNQLPFGFPNFVEVDKDLDVNRIKTHLMISMAHGRGTYVYVTPEV